MAKDHIEVGKSLGGVWHRSKDCYVVQVRVNGKKVQKSFGNNYEAAKIYAERIKQEGKIHKLKGDNPVLDQIIQCSSKYTVREVLDEYVKKREPLLKSGTIEFYEYLTNRLEPLWDVNAEKLTRAEIDQFITGLAGEGLSKKIVKEIISFGKSAFSLAVSHQQIAAHRNAFADIKAPKPDKFVPKPFTLEEIRKIFEQLNPNLRLMFWFQLSTGLRSGEMLALRFEDIDFSTMKINVQKTRRHGKENSPKTEASRREVFIPREVAKSINELRKQRDAKPSDYVFITQQDGKPYKDMPHEPWKHALERAGVDYRRPYTLRHAFASQALSDNVRLSYISNALGHTSVNVTAQKYIRHLPDSNAEDEQRINRLSEKANLKIVQ